MGWLLHCNSHFSSLWIATVAQLVAQRIRNAWVAGSSPASGFCKISILKAEDVEFSRDSAFFCFRVKNLNFKINLEAVLLKVKNTRSRERGICFIWSYHIIYLDDCFNLF